MSESIREMLEAMPIERRRTVLERLSEDRAAWKYLMSASKTKIVLHYGDAFGATAVALARSFGSVVSLDPRFEDLRFLEQWSSRAGVGNIAFVNGGSPRALPFRDGCFDAVVLDSVLEREPHQAQLELLKEVGRTLKPDGECYIGAENKYSYETLAGNAPRNVHGRSIRGYKKLLRRAGFTTQQFFAPHPDSRRISQLRGLPGSGRTRPELIRTKRASAKSALKTSRAFSGLTPSFSIVASRSPESPSFVERLADDALKTLGQGDAGDWIVRHFIVSSGKTFVTLTGSDSQAYPFIIKIPMTPYSGRRLRRNVDTLAALEKNPAVPESLRRRVPRNLASGEYLGQPYYVEQRIPGSDGEGSALFQHRDELLSTAAGLLRQLHVATANPVTLDEAAYDDLFLTPMTEVADFVGFDTGRDSFRKVAAWLKKMTLGCSLPLVRSHGDFSLKNILVDEASLDVRGIIDWDLSRKVSLPLIDGLHLLVRSTMVRERTSFEQTIMSHLFPLRFDGLDGEIFEEYCAALSIDRSLVPSLSVMYWLSRVHGHVGSDKDVDTEWVDRNFVQCLHELSRRL